MNKLSDSKPTPTLSDEELENVSGGARRSGPLGAHTDGKDSCKPTSPLTINAVCSSTDKCSDGLQSDLGSF